MAGFHPNESRNLKGGIPQTFQLFIFGIGNRGFGPAPCALISLVKLPSGFFSFFLLLVLLRDLLVLLLQVVFDDFFSSRMTLQDVADDVSEEVAIEEGAAVEAPVTPIDLQSPELFIGEVCSLQSFLEVDSLGDNRQPAAGSC